MPRCQRRRKKARRARRSRPPSRAAGPPTASADDSAPAASGSRRNSARACRDSRVHARPSYACVPATPPAAAVRTRRATIRRRAASPGPAMIDRMAASWSSRAPRSGRPATPRPGWPPSSPAPTWSPPRTPAGSSGCAPTSASRSSGRVVSYFEGNEAGPHPRAARGAARRRAGRAGHRRGHAERLRPRLPAGGRGGRARRARHRGARARARC